MSFPNDIRMLSPETPVRFAGWESTTWKLQQAGWEISAQQDCHLNYNLRLAIKHPVLQMYGITNTLDMDFFRRQIMTFANPYRYEGPPFEVVQMAHDLRIMVYDNLTDFQPIDATPQFIENKVTCMEDLNIFKTLTRTKEIIVAPENVDEVLNMALGFQSQKQKELRGKKRKNYRRFQRKLQDFTKDVDLNEPIEDIVAQIAI